MNSKLLKYTLCAIVSCTHGDKEKWVAAIETNLNTSNELYTEMLCDYSDCYIFGSQAVAGGLSSRITIEKASVGSLNSWADLSCYIEGICEVVSQTDRYLYLISRKDLESSDKKVKSSHILYRISKLNEEPTKVYEWTAENSVFSHLTMRSDSIGIAIFRPTGNPIDNLLLRTIDGGQTWDSIRLNRQVGNVQISGSDIYFTSGTGNSRNWIIRVDSSGFFDEQQFSINISDFDVYSIDSCLILGTDAFNKNALWLSINGKLKLIEEFSSREKMLPKSLYRSDNGFVVLFQEATSRALNFSGNTSRLYVLADTTESTWNSFRMEEALYLNPITQLPDSRLVMYAGIGKLITITSSSRK